GTTVPVTVISTIPVPVAIADSVVVAISDSVVITIPIPIAAPVAIAILGLSRRACDNSRPGEKHDAKSRSYNCIFHLNQPHIRSPSLSLAPIPSSDSLDYYQAPKVACTNF